MSLQYVPLEQFERIRAADADPAERAAAFADACRINVLYMIARAGSGHIGTSFSCMDIARLASPRGARGGRPLLLLQGPRRSRRSTRC